MAIVLTPEDIKIDNVQFVNGDSKLRFRFDLEIVVDPAANSAAHDPKSRPGSLRFYRCGLYKTSDGKYFAQLPTFNRNMALNDPNTGKPAEANYTKSGSLPYSWVDMITGAAQKAAQELAASAIS